MSRPYLLDNLDDGNTHGAGLSVLLDRYEELPVAVATGYVNLEGLHHLAEAIEEGRPVRLLLGAQPDPALGAQLPGRRFEQTMAALAGDRDLARFPPSRQAAQLDAIDAWLDRPEVQVRRYAARFVHGKTYCFGTSGEGEAVLVTSANLTRAGLFSNLELGLVDYNPRPANDALGWFDRLWNKAEDFKGQLRELLFPDPGLLEPRQVYLRALLDLYGEELQADVDDRPPLQAIELADFQRDGYERARRILARHNGVVYADGVGTGKTMVGLAFIEEYALNRGHHALVVAPAQLRDTWREHILRARLPAQVVSFSQLALDEQLAPDNERARRVLANDRDSYRLVVVDEAHALRNPDTTWHQAAARLLGGRQKDAVLLTATPVNNGLWDLYHLIMLFARHDRALAGAGVPSLRDAFVQAGANAADPENLNPDVLFPVADQVSVRRDRQFIETNWPNAVFPDGTPVAFPDPQLSTERYDLDAAHPGLFEEIVGRMDELSMARYRPSAYEHGGEPEQHEEILSGLLRSGVLKRFESCWQACLNTVNRMTAAHEAFLAAWDEAGVVPSSEQLREAALAEVDETGLSGWLDEQLPGDADTRPIEEFDEEFHEHVADDLGHLQIIRDQLEQLSVGQDPKLALLLRLLEQADDEKVAVFTTFGDTVDYLDEHLPEQVGGRRRVAVVGTATDPDQRAAALARFAPDTVVRPGYQPPDGQVDLLVSTDVLSEGQNLQQASAVINYDMPWNPQKVVQRNGRVIRLLSPHEQVHLTTMLPAPGEFDRLLGLEARIRTKIAAARLYGIDAPVVDDQQVKDELRVYADRLQQGDPSLLEEDSDEPAAAFAGEQLRALLDRAAYEGELARIEQLPWGIGSAFHQAAEVPSRGPAGMFLAFRTAAGDRYWRYVQPDGTIIDQEAEILRRINPGNAPTADYDVRISLQEAWELAADDVVSTHNEQAGPEATPSVGPAQRFALELLRDPNVALPAGAEVAEQALSVARGTSLRRALNQIRSRLNDAEISPNQAAQQIVDLIDEFRLQPVEEPEPAEPITTDDLGVVCWLAVQTGAATASRPGLP